MKKKILSLLLALVMALSLVPTSVLAAPVDLGKAHVIVENTTFTKPVDGKAPAWTGTLVDTWVKLTEDSTMMGCVFEALDAKGYTHTGTTYIGEINGLSEFDGGGQSGWMGTLNDWFANEGFAAFTVAAGKLEAGDEIRVMYSCAYGNVYLNINQKGYLNLEQGQTRELDVFRCWQAIENFMNAQIALPDVHYTVVDLNGQSSDVVTITPDENNSSLAYMKANKAGTAIVLVTYDAMTHMQGQTSNKENRGFSAIWPECTGVFVVSVGADGSSIATNMTMDRMDATISSDAQKALDAEHDILFYLGDAGASYSFKPEEGCTVTVARSTVTDKMTFNGFTDSGVTVAADGTVTVTGLTTGRHILCVEKDGVKTYQVVTAGASAMTSWMRTAMSSPQAPSSRPGTR